MTWLSSRIRVSFLAELFVVAALCRGDGVSTGDDPKIQEYLDGYTGGSLDRQALYCYVGLRYFEPGGVKELGGLLTAGADHGS